VKNRFFTVSADPFKKSKVLFGAEGMKAWPHAEAGGVGAFERDRVIRRVIFGDILLLCHGGE
jgi:hypothetical protein